MWGVSEWVEFNAPLHIIQAISEAENVRRYSYFSVWTRAWTRLVGNTFCVENTVVEIKHEKLGDNLILLCEN